MILSQNIYGYGSWYAKLFIKKNLLLTMYYKENFMWNSIIVTTVRWIAINDLIMRKTFDK
jgi:hypothetical protein